MPTPTTPGIFLRGGNKDDFTGEDSIKSREIVMALDTGELGTTNGWFDPFTPVDNSGRIGSIYYQYDSTTRTFGTSFIDGMIWDEKQFKGSSRVRIDWRVPMRNDNSSWGGGYTEIRYSYDGGTNWRSMGNSGFDGPMAIGGDIITSMSGSFTLQNCPTSDFGLTVKFRHRSYNDTLTVNGSHDIQTGDDGAFWSNITFTEILA